MGDLYAALGIVALISVGLFCAALWLTQSVRQRVCDVLALSTIGAMVFYTIYIWDQPILARLFPYSSLIILGNWYPLFTGFLAGMVWNRVPGTASRKTLFVLALGLAGFYAVFRPMQGLPPDCRDKWVDGVCLQSSLATCSTASAATLLAMHGVEASEQEMAGLCLTREGTHWQGLYRGLKLKTAKTGWDVEFFRCTLDELKQKGPGPFILTVELKPGDDVGLSEDAQRGWISGVSHSVVLISISDDGMVLVGDPSIGREVWTAGDFKVLWQGEGMRLVHR